MVITPDLMPEFNCKTVLQTPSTNRFIQPCHWLYNKLSVIHSTGVTSLNERITIGRKQDIAAMLDSLQELFQEYGDKVTPKHLAERMQQKLNEQVPLHMVSYIYTILGFITRKTDDNKGGYYIIHNSKLLAEKRAQFCKADISSTNHQSKR